MSAMSTAEVKIVLNNKAMVTDSEDYAEGANHARDLVASGFRADVALGMAIRSDDDWDRGYVETLEALAK